MAERRPQIQRRLLAWHGRYQRDLPWRKTRDPYKILVSEVMLQQTQVDRVIPKYLAWLKTWPTVKALAGAPLRQVLQAWSGLGYNRRAVHLRLAARMVIDAYGGKIPTTVEALETLPGVGAYTARAVMAFAYRKKVGLIDTNVRRVIGRVEFGVRGPQSVHQLQTAVDRLVPDRTPDTWQHALMDLGATVCVSRRPKCEACPLQDFCQAYPAILKLTMTRSRPTVLFVHTDRFWRGRIMALVLEQPKVTVSILRRRLASYGNLAPDRFEKLLDDLAAQGLVERRQRFIKVPT